MSADFECFADCDRTRSSLDLLNLSPHHAMSGSMQHDIDADSIIGKDN